ncbi:MAG: hypothetical protein HY370_09145 [Proteobacteria bacterium]|nr:hypothetical protein [Pseudomonadota bacterium]
MTETGAEILRRIGLADRGYGGRADNPIVLTGSAADPKGLLTVALTSETHIDKKGFPADIKLTWWRHLPFGGSANQSLARISYAPSGKQGARQLDEVWILGSRVFSRAAGDTLDNPATRKSVHRVFEAVNRLNTLLCEGGSIENTAKILEECYIRQVAGEDFALQGVSREGGFSFLLSPYFTTTGAQGAHENLVFRETDFEQMKRVLGCRVNTLEKSRSFDGNRRTSSVDPQSGVLYEAVSEMRQAKNSLRLKVSVDTDENDQGARGIPDLLDLTFARKGGDVVLEKAVFMGRAIQPKDTDRLLGLIGFTQAVIRDFADYKFPAFRDWMAKYNLTDLSNPLPQPKPLEEGGSFYYVSLHGCGFEKKIENFGDQIGIAALFLHCGLKKDGSVSRIGTAIDFPFATGGPDSNFDGAIPDYLQFWDDIKCFCITHDHFDHADGLPYYAARGMMKGKEVYATDYVKRALERKMNNLNVPARLRPKIHVIEKEGAVPVLDDEGNVRTWVQYSANATEHSALCTPYIVTGCYNDVHYNGSAVIYGDANEMTEIGKGFMTRNVMVLPEQAALHNRPVTREKLGRLLLTLHDVTAVRHDGFAPRKQEVQDNLEKLFGMFSDKGILFAPISTNHSEYIVGLNVAVKTERNVVGVGGNAEERLRTMNLLGVHPHLDLRKVEISLNDGVIPAEIVENYLAYINREADTECSEKERQACVKKLHQARLEHMMEKIHPSKREKMQSTDIYMLRSLQEYGALVFENDLNGYLMYQAIKNKQRHASNRAGRTSATGKNFRDDPENLLIFITGTQGNVEEKKSTLQKIVDSISLLDNDEATSSTGYKIDMDKYIAIITQPAIVGNEDYQETMIRELIRKRNLTVVGAYINGFKIYNPKGRRAAIERSLDSMGWQRKTLNDGTIQVYGRPIHVHGHGFAGNMVQIARLIPSQLHECHHIPDYDSYNAFTNLMGRNGLTHSGIKPDDFKVFELDAHAEEKEDKFKCVAQLDPSYILLRNDRRFGQFHGGSLEMVRATMARREGQNREDGLAARSSGEDVFRKLTASVDWEIVSNPRKKPDNWRPEKVGPSIADVRERPRKPRSRMIFGMPEAGVA